ncbi:dihydroxyacetone kinase subunit DhaL [Heyndrickxia ginsengihumi]|uniref:dihydroxyacetone kinase subunit DhaL n=1 Tax=Heyndrickxia ginsengihumi TaxID=363870 RepID=UPI001DD67B77|nr:dihydroxyacetone kinase subunit DhaL [Heyndrickxia ginsengihumi]MBE6185017.1 dihydroxyacetone kinase subunit L [Bacillus sp. (in: firmicutes)]MCM3023966.1 dihydroxyacetone kinase subunit DhaL [Heyndrickxia ginsengihumi]
MELTAKDLKNYFKAVVSMIEEEKDYLCELDRKLGDGDHGVTMSIGWQAVNEKLDNALAEEEDCAKISITVGKTFLSAVGSSVGPLYATGFMRGAKVVKNKTVLNGQDLVEYWIAFGKGIKERGQAEVGDKTMVDTLVPFVNALEEKFPETQDFLSAFSYAVSEGKKGMESTKDLLSKRGRSSRLGERSVGAQDPGATSAYLILSTFLNFVEKRSSKAS